MLLSENLRLALGALAANKLRSVLTTLGIIIGVAAVIAVVSVVQGIQYLATNVFAQVGASYMMVLPKPNEQAATKHAHQVKLTWSDGLAIRSEVPGVQLISPVIAGNAEMKYRDRHHRPQFIIGVTSDFQEVMNYTVERGRFFSDFDLENRRKVVVVGTKVVDELRLGEDPIGKEIYVGNLAATVIGVMEKKGQTLGQNFDDLAFLPFESALLLFGHEAGDRVQLRLQAKSPADVDEVRDGVSDLLRRRHRLATGQRDDFQIIVQDEILKAISGFLSGVTAVIGGVVAISLVVGGIGIMNIMLVSVTERTREIGVRKAVGARRQDVLVQFLIEAVSLSLIGGGIGLGLGYGIGALVIALVPANLPPAHVPLWAVGLSFLFSSLVGVFFGIYPAGKAARLDPIEALRYE